MDDIGKAKSGRKAINDEIAKLFAELEANGMMKEVVKMLLRYGDWDEVKQQQFDHAFPIMQAWFRSPQTDLFKQNGPNAH